MILPQEIWRNKNDWTQKCIFLSLFLLLLFSQIISYSQAEDEKTLIYYGDVSCHVCHVKMEIVDDFISQHSDVNLEKHMLDLRIPDNLEFIEKEFEKYGINTILVPMVVLIDGDEIIVLDYRDITLPNLESWYYGRDISSSDRELSLGVSFLSGMIIGASPCILLILGIFGTSLTLNKEKQKYVSIMVGFILGLLIAYLIVSSLFLFAVQNLGILIYFKYIFSSILMIIGLWQIIDYKNENSTIFGTPKKIKEILKTKFSQNSFRAALSIGIIFAFIKIPCFGGAYLTILYTVRNDPALWTYVLSYLIGMILPIIGVFILLKRGLKQEKVDRFRLNYRPHLRFLSGLFIITLTLHLLLEEFGFTMNILMFVLLFQIIIMAYFIKKRSNKKEGRGK